jgi:hypothetical protein
MSSVGRLKLRITRALRHMTPRHVVKTRMTSRAIRQFADSLGMVYFGLVHQRDDDHRLVRGHTVSATHRDDNYCVGTVQGYDTVLVSRNDVIRTRDRKLQRCHWLICAIDLHTKTDIPHVYIGHVTREDAFAASYEQLTRVEPGVTAPYPHHFISDYNVYCAPGSLTAVEQVVTPQTAAVIATHFGGVSIEIEDQTIYLYIESEHPRAQLLERMLSNAVWLARTIDDAAPQV